MLLLAKGLNLQRLGAMLRRIKIGPFFCIWDASCAEKQPPPKAQLEADPTIGERHEKAKSSPNHPRNTAVRGHTWAHFATVKTGKSLEVLDFLKRKEMECGT